MKTIPTKLTGARKALISGFLAAAALCAVVPGYAQNLIPANAGFEDSVNVEPNFDWPTTNTWRRGNAGLTPYTDASNPQSGTKNVVLFQFNSDGSGYFGLNFVGAPDPLTGGNPTSTTDNMAPITLGQMYTVSFFANRWVDTIAPDNVNKGLVDPTSTSLPDARLTLQLYTSTDNALGGGSFFGSNLAFDPQAGGTSGAYTQGAWTQYSTTFTADQTGFLSMFYKIKSAGFTGYSDPGAAGVKYGIDNVSVTAVPEPSTYAALALGGCLLLLARRRSKLA